MNSPCPVCESQEPRQLAANLGSYDVLHCSSCHSDSVEPLPSLGALARAYQDFDAGRIARESLNTFSSQARQILGADLAAAGMDRVAPSDRFLDYGCGGGHFVRAAADLGFAAFGLDLDDASSRFGKRHGLRIESGTIEHVECAFGAAPFRAVLMMHVLEHVPEPHVILERLVDHIEPGGCLIVGVPDQDSFPSYLKMFLRRFGVKRSELGFVQPPIHLHGFRLESFHAIAPRLALEVVSARKTGPLDRETFPSSPLYWKGLAVQRAVYACGRLLGSGGHLKVILKRSAAA